MHLKLFSRVNSRQESCRCFHLNDCCVLQLRVAENRTLFRKLYYIEKEEIDKFISRSFSSGFGLKQKKRKSEEKDWEKSYKMKKFAFLLLASFICEQLNAQPLIQISQGKLKGTFLKSRSGRKYSAFLGIPYAQPPIGNLR